MKFQFATDGEGNYGYLGADDSFIPFKKSAGATLYKLINKSTMSMSGSDFSFTTEEFIDKAVIFITSGRDNSGITFTTSISGCTIDSIINTSAIQISSTGKYFGSSCLFVSNLEIGTHTLNDGWRCGATIAIVKID